VVAVHANTSDLINVTISNVVDRVNSPLVEENWTIALGAASRRLSLCIGGRAMRDGEIRAVRHSVYLRANSIHGLFSRGVVQMSLAAPGHDFFASRDAAYRVYALGGGTGFDARFGAAVTPNTTTVLLSSATGDPYWSGFQRVMAGQYGTLDVWDGGWSGKPAVALVRGESWADAMELAPNDKNFPPPPDDEVLAAKMDADDLEAMHTAVYGSAVGCLTTYDNEVEIGQRVAQVATTIARPDRGYGGTYNYFDPDNYLTMSALIYSGEPFLQEQARLVIERSGAFLLPNGQLPHHFVGAKPDYSALSGATQTGPNTFWTLAALSYARNSGNAAWLASYMPTLRRAASFCFDLIDPTAALLKAPGPLMIDVFLRSNFTADSNAMVVGFLREFAEAEDAVGNGTGAASLRTLAGRVSDAAGADHYITQLNPDGTTRDFVDYDANLIAVAHGVADANRSARILARVDGGRCSAAQGGGPQFVSEVWYGPDDTTSGNTGDSWCSMARIALFDARARQRLGATPAGVAALNTTLDLLEHELLRCKEAPWMHERFGCDGQQQLNRTYAYFEYPSLIAMLLREVRYGVHVGFQTVSIAPFGVTRGFEYAVGNVRVAYSRARIAVSIPGDGHRSFVVEGMEVGARYQVVACEQPADAAIVDATGTLRFDVDIHGGCPTTATLV